MQYRPEIDGLRAIAVLPVIFYHADFSIFQGGYVGVDVFFVISGYLITSIILSEIFNTTFSIANFYERRARRILPALLFISSFTVFAAWSLLPPIEFKDFGQSLFAVSIFSSNILFSRTEVCNSVDKTVVIPDIIRSKGKTIIKPRIFIVNCHADLILFFIIYPQSIQ